MLQWMSRFFFLFLLCFNASIIAQTRAVILIKKPGSDVSVPLKLHTLSIKVKVLGSLAQTTLDMTYYNALDRVLEGNFYLPLGAGQTVSAYALEVNGKLRQGVVVEREQARVAFESTVRRKIDPGLLEWTKGNTFKSRIYPIPAKGYKRLVVTFEQELKTLDKGFLYSLPLNFSHKVDFFRLHTEVFKQEVSPQLPKENELVNFRFRKWRESFLADVEYQNYLPEQTLAFLLPKTQAYRKVVTEVNKTRGVRFFYIHLIPKIQQVTKKKPQSIDLYWDASASAKNRDLQREMRLLDSYLQKIGDARIRLFVFRNQVEAAEKFVLRGGNWSALRQRLQSISYDGGTSLGNLDLQHCSCEEILLFTDGISNFGKSEVRTGTVPVSIINSSNTAQHSYLQYLAQKTGGSYINLTVLTQKEAFAQLTSVSYRFMGVEVLSGAVRAVYPQAGAVVQRAFSLAGIWTGQTTRLRLRFGAGGKVLQTQDVDIPADTKNPRIRPVSNAWLQNRIIKRGMLERIWAQKKIADLDMLPEKNRQELISIGKKFSIVTRYTSLLVLDRVEDYAQHKIIPPKELQQEYYAILAKEKATQQKEKIEHLEQMVVKYQEMQEWWNTKFSLGLPPQPKKQKKYPIPIYDGSPSAGNSSENQFEEDEIREEPAAEVDSNRAPAARPARQAKSKEDTNKKGTSSGSIVMKKWNPNTPYLKKLKASKKSELYAEYLQLRKEYESSAFFLDVADFFLQQKKDKLALRILSNLAEMDLQNHQLLRILAHRLSQMKRYDLAAAVFREVLKMRGEEPQSYRDLALVYARSGKPQQAVDLLYKVVLGKWDSRFPNISLIALHEMNAIIARNQSVKTATIDRRLLKNLPVDVRVVLNWDADNTDMDLWVTDPNEEKCFYSHNRTFVGGRMSDDFTGGYGPEIYLLRRAKNGKYLIQVNYYGNSQQILAGDTTVQAQLFLHYGTAKQSIKEITLRLKDKKEVVDIGEFIFQSKLTTTRNSWFDFID
ncbi:MAG: VIT domain-containing protein [Spirochaetota bacterium]